MRIATLLLAGALGLAGCAQKAAVTGAAGATTTTLTTTTTSTAPAVSTPQVTMSDVVAKLQSFYAALKADAAGWLATHPAEAEVVDKVEAILDPEIAALSADTPPTTISAVIADVENEVNALPSGVLSQAHKDWLTAAATLAQLFLMVDNETAGPPIPWVKPGETVTIRQMARR